MVATFVTSAALAAPVWLHRATTVRCRAETRDQKCRGAFILNPPRRADPAQFARRSCSARIPAANPCLAVGGVLWNLPDVPSLPGTRDGAPGPLICPCAIVLTPIPAASRPCSAVPIPPLGCRTTWRSHRSLFSSFFPVMGRAPVSVRFLEPLASGSARPFEYRYLMGITCCARGRLPRSQAPSRQPTCGHSQPERRAWRLESKALIDVP